ncbi:NADAR family protein [Lacihabitans lacunae]|uniref:NADAR family protein n=1 Tax=Lacihabitans lacunae TaxID=1028214 RepID=A0ABV7YQV6_9BACT
MELKYYQYRLGTAKFIAGEMHASLHQFDFDKQLSDTIFGRQIIECITSDKYSKLISKHIQRGINIGDNKHTTLVAAPDFPIKSFEPGYFNPKRIELGLSGGDICFYQPDLLVESYYYFWETKHPFSQWHKCSFELEDKIFTSAEQYMMYGKAMLFGDKETATKILRTNNVREQKQLGRQVKNFNKEIWDLHAPTIVYRGNREKFIQNNELLDLLSSTKGKTIVEASPDDNIWGIGLTEKQEEAKSIFTWKGTNWLGIVLTELREEFLGNKFENGYLTLEEFKTKMIKSW